jgi:anti-anti-sigma regulatory factor
MNRENVAAVSGLPAIVPTTKAPSSALSVELRLHGDVALLCCRGRLVYRQESKELTTIVSDLLGLTRRLVVDLSEVERADSAGLGELVMLHMWADGMGYAIAFAAPTARVRNLLELTNLVSMLGAWHARRGAERCTDVRVRESVVRSRQSVASSQ